MIPIRTSVVYRWPRHVAVPYTPPEAEAGEVVALHVS